MEKTKESEEFTWKDKETLERLVDAYGLNSLLSNLATVCLEKADHIAASYSDQTTADTWNGAATNMLIASEFVFSRRLTITRL